MEHKVITYFKCKESGENYSLDSLYVSTNYDRVQHLAKLGLIVPNKNIESLKVSEKQPAKRVRKKKVVDEDVAEN